MSEMTLEVMGESQIHYKLSRFAAAVADWTGLWEQLIADFKEMEVEQFDSEGSRMGVDWVQLSDNPPGQGYASYKEQVRPGTKILYFDGDLFEAVTNPVVDIQPEEMTIAVFSSVFAYHQQGTENMPAREIVRMTEPDLDRWRQMTHRFVYDQMQAAMEVGNVGA
jgi:hypothetical protein